MNVFQSAMKRLVFAWAIFFGMFAAVSVVSAPAYAEKAPTIILIVDMNALFTQSDVGKDVTRQVREQVAALKTEDQTTRESLAAEAKTIQAQRENLTQDELQVKAADIAQRQQIHIQKIAQRQQAIQLGQAQANAEIASVIKSIFGELLVKHDAGLLIDQSNVLAGGLDLNITSEAMALLNQRLSKLTVTPVDPATLDTGR